MISCPLDRVDNFYIVRDGGIIFLLFITMKTEILVNNVQVFIKLNQ